MLVLSRKLGEKIVIGENIVLTVVKLDGNHVRLGIEAPSEILVYREELGSSFTRSIDSPKTEAPPLRRLDNH